MDGPQQSSPGSQPLRLKRIVAPPAQLGSVPPVVGQPHYSSEMIVAMRSEYRRIKADRFIWRILSLGFGGGGLALILLVVPSFDKPHPSSHDQTVSTISALAGIIMLGLGLSFSAKFKGRSQAWGLSAMFSRVGLIRKATEADPLKQRLDELRRILQAHGDKL